MGEDTAEEKNINKLQKKCFHEYEIRIKQATVQC